MTSQTLQSGLMQTVSQLVKEFDSITDERRKILHQLTQFIKESVAAKHKVYLNFICTHNSRRSHISQIWAQTAAYYYGVPGVMCFSGGTEATAFNPRAVEAMQDAGFDIIKTKEGQNPTYSVTFAEGVDPVIAFSKKYDDLFNPKKDFAAVMTCSHADENCPVILGATTRIALTYDDPKDFDGTAQEAAKYQERVNEIGREILYAFSQVSSNNIG